MWWKRLILSLLWLPYCLSAESSWGQSYEETPEALAQWPGPRGPLDRVEVVSSALKVLPRRKSRTRRSAQEGVWRKPRDYQFVTKSAQGLRTPRRLSYPEEEAYQQPDYYERRRQDFPNKRIIYYATLPEVVRRPGEWTPPRPIYSGYPPVRDNEIVTRVHSGLIDVTNGGGPPPLLSSGSSPSPVTSNRYEDLPPRFTIIDAEPPYKRPPPERYQPQYQPSYQPSYQPPYQPPRGYDDYDYKRYNYNRYDFRNGVDPYRSSDHYYKPYYDLPPVHHQNLPSQPVTVVREPVDVRPLDIRPLDVRPLHPLSTQGPPLDQGTTTQQPTTTEKDMELSKYERRTFKS